MLTARLTTSTFALASAATPLPFNAAIDEIVSRTPAAISPEASFGRLTSGMHITPELRPALKSTWTCYVSDGSDDDYDSGPMIPSSKGDPRDTPLSVMIQLQQDLNGNRPLSRLYRRYMIKIHHIQHSHPKIFQDPRLRDKTNLLLKFTRNELIEPQRKALSDAVEVIIERLRAEPQDEDLKEVSVSEQQKKEMWVQNWLAQTAEINDPEELAQRLYMISEVFFRSASHGDSRALAREARFIYEHIKNDLAEQKKANVTELAIPQPYTSDGREVILTVLSERALCGLLAESRLLEKIMKNHPLISPDVDGPESLPYRSSTQTSEALVRVSQDTSLAPQSGEPLSAVKSVAMITLGLGTCMTMPAWGPAWFAVAGSVIGVKILFRRLANRGSNIERLQSRAEEGHVAAYKKLFALADKGNAEAFNVLSNLEQVNLLPLKAFRLEISRGKTMLRIMFRLLHDFGNWRMIAGLFELRREYEAIQDLLAAIEPDNDELIAHISQDADEAGPALQKVARYYPNIKSLLENAGIAVDLHYLTE